MKLSLKCIALGTTALGLILSQIAWAEDPESEAPKTEAEATDSSSGVTFEDSSNDLDDPVDLFSADDGSDALLEYEMVPDDSVATEVEDQGTLDELEREVISQDNPPEGSSDDETDSPPTEEGDSIIDDLINAAPKREESLSGVSGDEGSVPNELGEGSKTAAELDPAGILGLAANEASVGGYLGVPASFSTKLRVSYDSNVCENYNSGSLFLPNYGNYDQRLVDDTMDLIDNLSDDDFMDFMDWLDGAGPPRMVLRMSPLGRAMDAVDWLTDAEMDEIWWQTEERDDDLYYGGPVRLKVSFSGIFAQALVPKTPLLVTGPRYFTPRISGYSTPLPTMTLQQGLTADDLKNLENLFNETGGGVVAPKEDEGWSVVVPYGSLYNYDRFQLRAAYNYGLDNNITDGSVPTVEYSSDYNTPYLDELTTKFEQALSDDLAASLTGFYNKTDIRIDLSAPTDVDVQLIDLQVPITPSSLNFWRPEKGGMVTIDPPTLDLEAGPSDEPIESVIPELSDPFRIEGRIGQSIEDVVPQLDNISPRIGLSYDIGPGISLRIPLDYNIPAGRTPDNSTTTTTTEKDPPGTTYSSNIKFKIEESVFENNQVNTGPAQEVVVKLGFPIPPLPLDGNIRIDDGASDNPLQGEVDGQGNFNLKYDYKDNFGIGIRAEYDYSGLDDTEVGDGSPPTLTLDEPAEDSTGWVVDPRMLRLNLEFKGGMTQIDPPTLDLSAGPSDAPIESVIPELGPMTGELVDEPATSTPDTTTGGDSRLAGPQTSINWQDVQRALGEFADIPAIDRMRDRDGQHEGWEPSTDSDTGTGQDTSTGANDTPFTWEDISPRISLTYDITGDGKTVLKGGLEGMTADYELGINMQPLGSKILYRTDPEATLGGLEAFSPRTFGIGNYRLSPIFYPLQYESEIDALIRDIPGIVRSEKNRYRDKQGDDPYFKSEGTWGQDYADQWAIQHIGFTGEDASAWAAAGDELAEVIVAVIDTGIDWNHADISWDSIWRNNGELPDNGIDDDGNGYIDDLVGWDFFLYNNLPWDEDGHGTFVTGIIAAISDNDTGISGINPAAKIMVIKALDSFGHTRASYLAEAIVYAVDNGAQIINLSVGGDGLTHAEELAVQYAEENGVLVFAAAGNKGYEASNFGFVPYETVVTVGSTTKEDTKSNFSNWGEGIDIMAPGEDVLSLRARRTDLMLNVRHLTYEMGTAYVGDDRRYYRAAGTSFSVPIVAGIASLILSKNPDLTPKQVRRMLYQSATDVDVPGRDQQTGFGLVDAAAAINADPAFEIIANISGVEVIQEKGQVLVSVQGTATANDFERAEVFIGRGENPENWKQVGERVKKPVTAGVLTKIPAGEFQGAPVWIIRIVVTHENGKTREERFTLTLG